MRSDQKVMKDISQHTRLPPPGRGEELESFVKGINSNKDVSGVNNNNNNNKKRKSVLVIESFFSLFSFFLSGTGTLGNHP
jgi:hypothetical protein